MQDKNGNMQYLFDFWADPFVHLLLLKSSMSSLYLLPAELQGCPSS